MLEPDAMRTKIREAYKEFTERSRKEPDILLIPKEQYEQLCRELCRSEELSPQATCCGARIEFSNLFGFVSN